MGVCCIEGRVDATGVCCINRRCECCLGGCFVGGHREHCGMGNGHDVEGLEGNGEGNIEVF